MRVADTVRRSRGRNSSDTPRCIGIVALVIVCALGCERGADGSPKPFMPSGPSLPEDSTLGKVKVTIATFGADFDPDGYVVQVDGVWDYTYPATRTPANGTVLLRAIEPGEHLLTLYELAPNCDGEQLEYRPIVVTAGRETAAEFRVECRVMGEGAGSS